METCKVKQFNPYNGQDIICNNKQYKDSIYCKNHKCHKSSCINSVDYYPFTFKITKYCRFHDTFFKRLFN